MAARDDRRDQRDETTCRPCRGTGTVVSNLGGTPSSIPCPWCGGTGVREPGRDAQAARAGADGA